MKANYKIKYLFVDWKYRNIKNCTKLNYFLKYKFGFSSLTYINTFDIYYIIKY